MKRVLLLLVFLICLGPLFAIDYQISDYGVKESAKNGKYFSLELTATEGASKINLDIYELAEVADCITFFKDPFIQGTIQSVFGSFNNLVLAGESFQFNNTRNSVSSTKHDVSLASKEYDTGAFSFQRGSIDNIIAALLNDGSAAFKATINCGKKKSFSNSFDIKLAEAKKAEALNEFNAFIAQSYGK